MAQYYENLNIADITEDNINGLIGLSVKKGKAVTGYYGLPFFNYEPGDAQFVVRTERREENKLNVTGIDAHAAGCSIWDLRLSEMNVDYKDCDKLRRRYAFTKKDGTGLIVSEIMNADVLPSFVPGDILKLQVAAIPVDFDYFEDEDAYNDSLPKDKHGKTFGVANGSIFPAGLLINGNPDRKEEIQLNDESWGYCTVRGTVKYFKHGMLKFDEEEFPPFVRCIIETEYGDLEVIHSFEQIKEEQKKLLKAGSIFSGMCLISSDAKIYEYNDGIVKDEEHNLMLLRYTFMGGDPVRLGAVLKDDSIYVAGDKTEYLGINNIVSRITYVNEQLKKEERKCTAYLATITDIDTPDDSIEYASGKRCIVLAYEDGEYDSILFIDTDEEGNISRMIINKDSRYNFKVDMIYTPPSIVDEIQRPESVTKPILLRAALNGFIESDDEIFRRIAIEAEDDEELVKMANTVAIRCRKRVSANEEISLEKVFGYMFEQAVEAEYIIRKELPDDLLPVFDVDEVWEGAINPKFDDQTNSDMKEAYDFGGLFYKDLSFFQAGEDNNDKYYDNLVKALVLVMKLGKYYCDDYIALSENFFQ